MALTYSVDEYLKSQEGPASLLIRKQNPPRLDPHISSGIICPDSKMVSII
jgi:hypothetical protein